MVKHSKITLDLSGVLKWAWPLHSCLDYLYPMSLIWKNLMGVQILVVQSGICLISFGFCKGNHWLAAIFLPLKQKINTLFLDWCAQTGLRFFLCGFWFKFPEYAP